MTIQKICEKYDITAYFPHLYYITRRVDLQAKNLAKRREMVYNIEAEEDRNDGKVRLWGLR